MDDPVYVGRYRVIEELGRGGMGIVYRGEDPVLERPVAIKVLLQKRLNQKMVERFLREAKTAARLDSPYIVKIHDIGQVDDVYFIVMELVDGCAFSSMIEEDVVPRPAQLRERLGIFRQVLEAVNYAHENQVIHRDLKPDNIMVSKSGRVKVMDFGLAFFQGHHSLTEVGQVMGTAAYVSPEQAQGKITDNRTDIYSLGVILFEIITGSWPFTATNPLDMFRKVAEMPPPSPRSINPTISLELDSLVLRMLAKRPEDRFQNIREILAVYDAAVAANSAEEAVAPIPMVAAPAKPLAPGEFDAQALLDSIVSSSDISKEWLDHINLEEALSDTAPVASLSAGTPKRPTPLAPGPALRQAIDQTSVDVGGAKSGSGQVPAFVPPASLAAALSASAPAPSADGQAASAAHGFAADHSKEEALLPTQAVSPAQYTSAPPKPSNGPAGAGGLNKPYVTAVKSGAVASNSWMANVASDSGQGGGRVENLLGRLQRQEEQVEAISANIGVGEESLFCPKCGAENQASSKVCEKCGSTLSISQYISQREAANYLEEGKSLYEKANYNEAIVSLLQAISKDSNSSEAYLYLGRAYLETGNYGEAHNAIERAVNLSTDAQPYVALADFYQYTGQPEMVISALQHALDREEMDTGTRCRLAFSYREMGRLDAAIQEYRRVVEIDPQHLEANRQLGMILADCQRYDEAITYLEQVCYLDPRDSSAYSLLSRLYIQAGRIS